MAKRRPEDEMEKRQVGVVRVLRFIKLPPQPRSVLASEYPPNVLRAVYGFAHEVPSCIEEGVDVLHLGGC